MRKRQRNSQANQHQSQMRSHSCKLFQRNRWVGVSNKKLAIPSVWENCSHWMLNCLNILYAGAVGRNRDCFKQKLVICEHFFGAAVPKKVVPSTHQFSIGFSVVKCSKYNQFFHPRCKSTLNCSRFAVGRLFGQGRAEDVFAFHEFWIFLIRFFAKCQKLKLSKRFPSEWC